MRTATSIEFPFEQFTDIEFLNTQYMEKVWDDCKKMGSEAIDELLRALSKKNEVMRINNACMALSPDFARHSFGFEYYRSRSAYLKGDPPYTAGGLIYSGPGLPLDGSGPQFTVSVDAPSGQHTWSSHT